MSAEAGKLAQAARNPPKRQPSSLSGSKSSPNLKGKPPGKLPPLNPDEQTLKADASKGMIVGRQPRSMATAAARKVTNAVVAVSRASTLAGLPPGALPQSQRQ